MSGESYKEEVYDDPIPQILGRVQIGVAHGFAAAIPDRLDVTVGYGRGERGCPATNDLPVAMRLAEPPEACEWLRSA